MDRDGHSKATLGILVGGGPAPGINGVISSAAIEAINCGLRVVGLRDGYRWLAEGDTSHITELHLDEVSQVHSTGGSFLRTSRTNPARDEASLERTINSIERLGLRYLVCIGGDDTTYGACRIAERTRGRVGVVTVPKTIDNDLPLPDNAPTFGFETARGRRDDRRVADGGCAHHRPLVSGDFDGPQVGLARAQHVQIGRRHAGRHPRRVP